MAIGAQSAAVVMSPYFWNFRETVAIGGEAVTLSSGISVAPGPHALRR